MGRPDFWDSTAGDDSDDGVDSEQSNTGTLGMLTHSGGSPQSTLGRLQESEHKGMNAQLRG